LFLLLSGNRMEDFFNISYSLRILLFSFFFPFPLLQGQDSSSKQPPPSPLPRFADEEGIFPSFFFPKSQKTGSNALPFSPRLRRSNFVPEDKGTDSFPFLSPREYGFMGFASWFSEVDDHKKISPPFFLLSGERENYASSSVPI